MDSGSRALTNIVPRSMLGFNNLMILTSSAVITGILSYFLHRFRGRGTHLVFNEVIAVTTLFLYLFTTVLPAIKSYGGYLLPLDLVLSYLWLTSLIFAAQDYAGGRCRWNSPPQTTHCGLKHTVLAFFVIGFTSLLLNTIFEAILWATHRRRSVVNGTVVDKAPMGTTTITSTANGGHTVVV